MDKYRLPSGRMTFLKLFCQEAPDNGQHETIMKVLLSVTDSAMADFIYRNVCRRERWNILRAHGVPCCADTFRFYRAKFFYYLDRELEKKNQKDVL